MAFHVSLGHLGHLSASTTNKNTNQTNQLFTSHRAGLVVGMNEAKWIGMSDLNDVDGRRKGEKREASCWKLELLEGMEL